jgi:Response regulator containing a CheY-like receiver domain and an HTH DNA-binding domain
MNFSISDFFEPIKATQYIGSYNYSHVEKHLNALKAISKICDLSYYIIDYYRKNFFYVSPNPLFLSGYSQEEVLKLGYDFYGECVAYEDLLLLFELNEAGFSFFYELPVERREHATISYDFKLKHKSNNSLVMINHKLAPLLLTEDGNIWMAICLVTLSSRKSSGDVHIIMQDNHTRYNFNRGKKLFMKIEIQNLTKKELEVLRWIAMGYCIDDIVSLMNISGSTIKNHKTSILKKMQVQNITEAVFNASKQGIL